ncbi:sel protein [Cryptosporidium bovis]|uniref:sel protein n=1 Tax=Cryptosporidium bovis TaxID=310047 RepID=UPI00351A27D4|nr:sel protein [Cryptosporidium bovis]
MLNKISFYVYISVYLLIVTGVGYNIGVNGKELNKEVAEIINRECKLNLPNEYVDADELFLNSECLLKVGDKYFIGDKYIKQDIEMAIAFWKVSSDLGNPEAQFNMGLAYFIYPSLNRLECGGLYNDKSNIISCDSLNFNSKDDIEKAIKYYKNELSRNKLFNDSYSHERKAYDKFTESIAYSNLYLYFSSLSGHKGAQLALGFRYENGLGFPNSCEAAFSNYLEVAKDCILEHRREGVIKHEELIRLSIPDWDPIKKLYSESENRNRHDLALNLAESGNIFIQLAVAKRYLMGSDGFPQNFNKSYKYLRKLAERAKNLAGTVLDTASTSIYGEAIGLLGYMYALGLGNDNNERDLDAASEYFSISAFIYNDPGGHNGMGYIYFHGCKEFEQNFRLSFHHFNESAHHLFPDAQYNLASLYLTGMGTTQSYSEALLWYTRAYEQGHAPASYALAQLNFNGLGINRDCKVAIQFLKNIIHKSPFVTDIVKDINKISNLKNYKLYSNINGLKFFLTLKLALTGHEPSLANIPSLIEKEYKKNNFWGASKFGINRNSDKINNFSVNGSTEHTASELFSKQNKYLFSLDLNKILDIQLVMYYLQIYLSYFMSYIFPYSLLNYLGIDTIADYYTNTETNINGNESFNNSEYSEKRDDQIMVESDPWYLPQIFIEMGISKDNLDSMIKYGDNSYYGRGSELRFVINNNNSDSHNLGNTERNIIPEIHLNNMPNYLVASDIYKIVSYFTLRSRHMISSISEACFNLGYMYQFGIGVKQNIKIAISYYKKMMEVGHIGRMSNGVGEFIIFLAKIHEFFISRTQFSTSLKQRDELKLLIMLIVALASLITAKLLLKIIYPAAVHIVNYLTNRCSTNSNDSTGNAYN